MITNNVKKYFREKCLNVLQDRTSALRRRFLWRRRRPGGIGLARRKRTQSIGRRGPDRTTKSLAHQRREQYRVHVLLYRSRTQLLQRAEHRSKRFPKNLQKDPASRILWKRRDRI